MPLIIEIDDHTGGFTVAVKRSIIVMVMYIVEEKIADDMTIPGIMIGRIGMIKIIKRILLKNGRMTEIIDSHRERGW
jgi:hypothetical protein